MKDRVKHLLILAGLLVAAFVIAYLIGGAAREAVVGPVLYVFWTISVFLGRMPQLLFWMLFITIAALLAFRSLYQTPNLRPDEDPVLFRVRGRVLLLARWLREAAYGFYFRQRLARHLLDLTLEANGYREKMSMMEISDLLTSGELKLSPEEISFLKNGLSLNGDDLDIMTTPYQRFLLFMQRTLWPERSQRYVEPGLDQLIARLENELEIQYDHQNQ